MAVMTVTRMHDLGDAGFDGPNDGAARLLILLDTRYTEVGIRLVPHIVDDMLCVGVQKV